MEKTLKGIRGAVVVDSNTEVSIIEATATLLTRISEANEIASEDIVSIFFTSTPDLNAVFPAKAAREIGWNDVPLICAQEIPVPDSLKSCVRVLLHVYVDADKKNSDISHIYLNGAEQLRPDLSKRK